MSKFENAVALYKTNVNVISEKEIISLMVEKIGYTPNTAYQNVKKIAKIFVAETKKEAATVVKKIKEEVIVEDNSSEFAYADFAADCFKHVPQFIIDYKRKNA